MRIPPLLRDSILGVVVAGCLAFAASSQMTRLEGTGFRFNLYEQRLRLPSPEILQLVTLGYDNIYANWLWLQAIQAFGAGWITDDGTTEPIYQYFVTMTELDPHFIPSYRFGNLVIGDNRRDWQRGQSLIRRGMIKNPQNYDLPYLGLYNAIWQYDDENSARFFAHFLRRNPRTPEFMRRMEEFIEREAGRYIAAFEFNVRFLLTYLARNNHIERDIVISRLNVLFDRQFRDHLSSAIDRYIDAHGEHPTALEQVLTPEFLDPIEAATASSFLIAFAENLNAIDVLSSERAVPEELVERIVERSVSQVVGLPPDQRIHLVGDRSFDVVNRWFYIRTIDRNFVLFNDLPQRRFRENAFVYLASIFDFESEVNAQSFAAQQFIMNFVRENDRRPTQEEVASFLGRDPIGGHFVYDPNDPLSPQFGTFYSTALRRIIEGQEPRVGARGFGPFPLPLEPTLRDFPRDQQWGREQGFILEDGTYLFLEPGMSFFMDDEAPEGAVFGPDRPE